MGKEYNDDELLTLCPQVHNNEINEKYGKTLDKLLSHNDCKNIALLGPYGSGKSSIIKTYFSSRRKLEKNKLTITIGYYISDVKSYETDGTIDSNEQSLVNQVEESILKQIIYRKSFTKFPKSTLIRFDKISNKIKLSHSICVLYMLMFVIYHIFKFNDKNITFDLLWDIFGLSGVLAALIVCYYFYKIIDSITNRVKVNKIKISDCEFELSQDSNSLFSRYLTEIVYFFQCTKYSVVVFEDLDRFPNDVALKVVQELKELNTILNGANGISKIVFIYAINDDIFEKVEDKNKFYDYNLSVLPISTSFNSELNLVGLLKQKKIYDYISTELIGIISKYVYDMRMLKNIVNDYCIFKDITNTENYDKLFAMVTYKNFYYKDYNKLGTSNDVLKCIIESTSEKKADIIRTLNENKKNIKNEIEKIEKEKLHNVEELKRLLLANNTIYDGSNSRTVTHYYLENSNQINISKFLSEDFDLNQLRNSSFELYRYGNGRIEEKDVFKKFGSKNNFLERYENTLNLSLAKIDKLNTEILSIENKKKKILNAKTEDIFKEYFSIQELKIDSKEKIDLISELICGGFISNDYMDYVTAPVIYDNNDSVESLKYSDSLFLMNIRQKKYSFDIKIIGYKTIIERIKNDFNSEYILNYNLLNYLIENGDYYNYVDEILEQFNTCSIEKLKFLIEFLKKNPHQSSFIFNVLKEKNIDIWSYCLNDMEELLSEDITFLTKEILFQKGYIHIIANLISIKNIIEDDLLFSSEELNEVLNDDIVKENVLVIKPRFLDINCLNDNNFSFIYFNNLYKFTANNIFRIADCKVWDINKLYSSNKTRNLADYISENIVLFCDEFYVNNDVKLNNEELVKSALNSCGDNYKIMRLLYIREEFQLRTTAGISKALYNYLLDYNHITITWENIFALYGEVDDKKLFSKVDNNIRKLLKTKIISPITDKIDVFFKKYILYLVDKDLKILKNVISFYTPKYTMLSNISKDELSIFINYNCIDFNRKNYNTIRKKSKSEELFKYVYNYYINRGITDFVKSISIEDIMNLCISENIDVTQKLEILYGLYKTEKRKNDTLAYENFTKRFITIFSNQKKYETIYKKSMYYAILNKMKKENIFEFFEINDNKIKFKLL